ncbi:hypothetical protein L1889_18300 [Paenalcaligenes niemegkensis]|uniref:hypothetical protein n=1 Tax=Paenalcaligenes niemegkensis TaxID=2895469 RepID=UPI001EE91A59|nr:hypothetical protein [Paenalcaligenes niemegkensis]MCQ9618392.1 hypothetical protein [Paenalcaligenes niemegkensis]
MEQKQGEELGISDNNLFEYESAIGLVAEAAKGADGLTLLILQAHLENLCNAHLKALRG